MRPRSVSMSLAAGAGLAGVVIIHLAGGSSGQLLVSGPPAGKTTPPATPPAHHRHPASSARNTPTTTTVPVGGLRGATGELVNYGYGVLSVRISVNGSHITDVGVARLQTAEQYSQQLAQQVIPMLKGEVLSVQSAHISAVSGATYTSEAYAMSLQSALDKLHIK